MQATRDYYRHAITAVSERFCPEHRIFLEESGWCTNCQAWWSIGRERKDGPYVVQTFPSLADY